MSPDHNQEALSKPAIEMLTDGIFPSDWRFVPTHGKNTYITEWPDKPLTVEDCVKAYEASPRYRGVGVVTGEHSGGLIAIDVDGFEADARYKAVAGEEYEEYGEEKTMCWTSGKAGRRQLLYRVPEALVPQLRNVRTVISQKHTHEWLLGQGDDAKKELTGDKYEELTLRFNRCQSVLPGSPHPDTKQFYKFLQYNDGVPAEAPPWVINVLMQFAAPVSWLSSADLAKLKEDVGGNTILPQAQIRGWFFSEKVQELLLPKLEDVIFKHPVFTKYGWVSRDSGANPQRLSGCPWHGGDSGTAFQYAVNSGVWICHACSVGGDVLDFVHKIETGDMSAERPTGMDLEKYVADIAKELGFKYPDDARGTQAFTENPRITMSTVEFFEALRVIQDEENNPAVRLGRMAELAQDTGRRLTGSQCLIALGEYLAYLNSAKSNEGKWYDVERLKFVIPGLLAKPTQVVLHAAAGHGKTSAMMAIACAIGRGKTMRVRGLEVPIKKGKVLWIQNDQSEAQLLENCEANGITMPEDASWFVVKRGFQINYQHDLRTWINDIKPDLVVVDSIGSCSTKVSVEEKDKAFASPFYDYALMNGKSADEGGFRPCAIVWIHHNNARGEMRGTKYLEAAVDERWHLRQLTREERDRLREEGKVSSNCRFIEIGKSRLGREGDVLVTERDENYAYHIWDYTPTEKREEFGTGDPEPDSVCLRILRDDARSGGSGMTVHEVWEILAGEQTGQGRRASSARSVRRWLARYQGQGLVVLGGHRLTGEKKNKRTPVYTIHSYISNDVVYPSSRAGCVSPDDLSAVAANWLQRSGLTADTGSDLSAVVRSSDGPPEDGEGTADTEEVVENGCPQLIPDGDCDLGELRTTDSDRCTTRGRGRATPTVDRSATVDSEGTEFDDAFG